MLSSIHITGQAPENFEHALAELKNELGFTVSPKGTPVTAVKGDHLGVVCDGKAVTITWAEPIQFYRALSLIPLDLSACHIHEEPAFETVGVMFDCSRNAVIAPQALKGFLRKMALQGLNLGMMYTEDTYEVPEQPFFGYKRGRYTYDELKSLDDYANNIAGSAAMNSIRWPALKNPTTVAKTGHTFEMNIAYLRKFLEDRYTFLNLEWRAD